jgi:hypothetical protein
MRQEYRRAAIIALAMAALLGPRGAQAQETTESVLKGAFVFNFVTFTEWPPDALMDGTPIRACVVGDPAVAGALTTNAAGRDIAGHALEVTTATVQSLAGCHVVYVSSPSALVVNQAIAATAGSSTLTISDVDTFARSGGVVELFVEAGKMRFRINLGSAMRAQLELSSRLLSLAELTDE